MDGDAQAAITSGYAWALGTAGLAFVLLAVLIAVDIRPQQAEYRSPSGLTRPPA